MIASIVGRSFVLWFDSFVLWSDSFVIWFVRSVFATAKCDAMLEGFFFFLLFVGMEFFQAKDFLHPTADDGLQLSRPCCTFCQSPIVLISDHHLIEEGRKKIGGKIERKKLKKSKFESTNKATFA